MCKINSGYHTIEEKLKMINYDKPPTMMRVAE